MEVGSTKCVNSEETSQEYYAKIDKKDLQVYPYSWLNSQLSKLAKIGDKLVNLSCRFLHVIPGLFPYFL